MTLTQPTQPTRPIPPIPAARRPAGRGAGLEGRVLAEGRRAHLREVLHGVIVNALGPDGRIALATEEWSRVEEAIREPIEAVADDALERLAAEIEATVKGRLPELGRRLDDHRLRAELGYD